MAGVDRSLKEANDLDRFEADSPFGALAMQTCGGGEAERETCHAAT